MRFWTRLLTLVCMTFLLSACGTTWTYNAKWRSENVKPEFLYQKDGIELSILSDPKLNLYENEPHTLRLCVYQLDSPRAFNQLSGEDDERGLMKLLECRLFDRSVVNGEDIIVYPGKDQTVTLDRMDDTEYLGIVAGYQSLDKRRISRRVEVPVFTGKKSTGFFSSTKVGKPGLMAVEIRLGPEQIESITEYARLPGESERILTGRSR